MSAYAYAYVKVWTSPKILYVSSFEKHGCCKTHLKLDNSSRLNKGNHDGRCLDIWSGLISKDFWDFISPFSPSVSIERTYQTLRTVFHHIAKHREVYKNFSAARRVFNSLLGVWKCGQTRTNPDFRVWWITCWPADLSSQVFSFNSGLHETADVLRREANLPDPRPEGNPLATPSNRKVFAMYFSPLLLFRSSFLYPRVLNKRCSHWKPLTKWWMSWTSVKRSFVDSVFESHLEWALVSTKCSGRYSFC